MSGLDLEEIKARTEAATPGPWHENDNWRIVQGDAYARCLAIWEAKPGDPLYDVYDEPEFVVIDTPGPAINKTADLKFIAHARQDVPSLIAEVERIQAEIVDLKRFLNQSQHARIDLVTACDAQITTVRDCALEIQALRAAIQAKGYAIEGTALAPLLVIPGPWNPLTCEPIEGDMNGPHGPVPGGGA